MSEFWVYASLPQPWPMLMMFPELWPLFSDGAQMRTVFRSYLCVRSMPR